MALAKRSKLKSNQVEFGSTEHGVLLGMSAEMVPNADKGAMEAALKTKPIVISDKVPITKENFIAASKRDPGDEIIDGWTRKGQG